MKHTMFPEMHTLIPQGKFGSAEIVHDRPSRMEIMRASFKGIHTEDRVHTRLLINGGVIMTDAAFEKRTNVDVVLAARGDVLIAGLGIGLILVPILAKKEVKRVVVVEKNADVIFLVEPHLRHKKLQVIHADIFEFSPTADWKFDTIYFDIWPDICGDNLGQMKSLAAKFRRHRRKGAFVNSWCKARLEYEERRGA